MNSRLKLFIIILLFVGVLVNVYLLLTPKPNVACFYDACFYSWEAQPEQAFKRFLNNHDNILLIAEGDEGQKTQTTMFVDLVFAQLSADLVRIGKNVTLVGVGLKEGKPVSCHYEVFNGSNFTSVNKSVEYCVSLEQGEGVLFLKYPSFSKDEVWISPERVVVRAESGKHLYAVTQILHEWIKQA